MKTLSLFVLLPLFLLTTLSSCDEEKSCNNTVCLNDGVCVSGTCDCPDQFTGQFCDQQSTPHKIVLHGVSVTRFPGSNNESAWDGSDGPDLFFRLYDEEGPLTQPTTLIENAAAGQSHAFLINTMFLFNMDQTYTLKLLDYEGVGIDAEEMGQVQFRIYEDDNGFPRTIVADEGGKVAFTLEVEYVHKPVEEL